MSALEERLRAALKEAMKSRDTVATSALRSAFGAIDNARSVEVEKARREDSSSYVAGSAEGLGAGDVLRRELSDGQIAEIVRDEAETRKRAADEYEGLGRAEEAGRLRAEWRVLLRLLPGVD